ncbi:thiopeptide-type bacteriocin biosynthesis protein [Mucilaginibacter sp. KACC 22063]|uniref:thiopeptide-type bacteriocin biosynthesis protein n=1 Tax=Mucilaginibacter sp. KACC 22063 TaxID=3025666 RepID=UPI002366CC78|nr:thiopeptide-type bacteriocin biosynthesis protein [Mucilaginibacter sp. KACC 22063]WDF55249.1 thiopeptide-type bacteriocin biosynthesis protein [Mucilaginibacter sp. KACC 22063]
MRNWKSVYIYFTLKPLDFLIHKFVEPLVNDLNLTTNGEFFFIRYFEGGPHVRLRFLSGSKSQFDFNEVLKSKYSEFLKSEFGITERPGEMVQAVPYVPEIERYGGDKVIRLAEKNFFESSKIILSLFKKERLDNYNQKMMCGFEMHLIFLVNMNLDKESLRQFLNFQIESWILHAWRIINKNENLQLQKDTVVEVCKSKFSEAIQANKELLKLKLKLIWDQCISGMFDDELIKSWNNHAKNFYNDYIALKTNFNSIIDTSLEKTKVPDTWRILGSLLHMTNNRLGISNHDESYLYYMLLIGIGGF